MLKRAKTVTSVCYFTKRTPRLRPEWLKMLGTNLTRFQTGQKIIELAKKTNLTELTQGRNILSLIKNILSREYSLTVNGICLFCQENILSLLDDMSDDVADDGAMWTPFWWRGWWLSAYVSDDVAVFSGENSGNVWFFRQIYGETSASSTGLVSTPILMIFISPDSYRREESPQLVKSKILELWKFCNFEQRAEKHVFLCLSFPNVLIPICCAYWTESKYK